MLRRALLSNFNGPAIKRWLGAIGVAFVVGLAAGSWWLYRAIDQIGPLSLAAGESTSVTVVDRKGHLLRAFTTPSGRWRLPLSHNEVDKRYLALLFAFEDKRFYEHHGIDVLAMIRAARQFATNGRIVSGASTLTMQVARLLQGPQQRSGFAKFRQMVRAIQLERRLSKAEILDLYLKLAPFGGNIEGVRAASLTYFAKEPRRLSLGQAALLVALPQSPETRRPDRHQGSARRARARVLARGVRAGLISQAEADRANAEKLLNRRHAFPMLAAHLAEAEVARSPAKVIHHTTLDRRLQSRLETLVRQHAAGLGKRLSAALIVVENATGNIISRVGSAGYFDARRFGAVDMTRAVRSPGSALKPVVYGLAFEFGLAHPETLIDDRPVRFGTYAPKNFDETYRGTISVREALGRSLNIPAVKLLDAVGPGRMVGRLRRAGVATELPEATTPSLAVALGGIGIRLEDMARLYTALARGGQTIALRQRTSDHANSDPSADDGTKSLLGPVAVHYVTDILKDAPPPPNAKKGRIAYKTGTSYGYRDAWAAGYDGRHTIVVWVGRPDAASTPGLMGRTAAAPILFDAFARISPHREPLPTAPGGALTRAGSDLPAPLKRFDRRDEAQTGGAFLDPPVRISFPPDRSHVELEDAEAALVLKARGGALPLTWFVDGAPIATNQRQRQLFWSAKRAGFVRLSVVDARGRTDRVIVRLQSQKP